MKHDIGVLAWDGPDFVVTVQGSPVGWCLPKMEAEVVAIWLQEHLQDLLGVLNSLPPVPPRPKPEHLKFGRPAVSCSGVWLVELASDQLMLGNQHGEARVLPAWKVKRALSRLFTQDLEEEAAAERSLQRAAELEEEWKGNGGKDVD